MHTTHYLLFGFSILGWVEVSFPTPDMSNMVKGMMAMTAGMSRQSKPDTFAPLILLKVPANEIWTLSLNKTYVTMTPRSDTKAIQTGGPFGTKKYNLTDIQMGWKKQPDGTYEAKAIVTCSNSNYSSKEALNHPDGKSQIYLPFHVNGTVNNTVFDRFLKVWENIEESGDSTPILSGDAVSWRVDFHSGKEMYQWFRNSAYSEKLKQDYNCSTTTKIPLRKNSTSISPSQFASLRSKVKDSSGNPVDDNTPPEGKPLSAIMKGKGYEVIIKRTMK